MFSDTLCSWFVMSEVSNLEHPAACSPRTEQSVILMRDTKLLMWQWVKGRVSWDQSHSLGRDKHIFNRPNHLQTTFSAVRPHSLSFSSMGMDFQSLQGYQYLLDIGNWTFIEYIDILWSKCSAKVKRQTYGIVNLIQHAVLVVSLKVIENGLGTSDLWT